MKILTLENRTYELDVLPEEIDDLRFSILDNSDTSDTDYFFIPLLACVLWPYVVPLPAPHSRCCGV